MYNIQGKIEHIGLSNIGNSCYINSALQLILHSEYMVQLLIERINENQPLVIEQIDEIRKQYSKFMNHQQIFEQCDASYFFNYLLDRINDTYPTKFNPVCSIEIKARTKCQQCDDTYTSTQHENMLIAYPQPGFDCLLDCISASFTETVEKKCDGCKQQVQAKRKLQLCNAPLCLYIRLQPILMDENTSMDIPMDLQYNTSNSYELKGFIEHRGTSIHYGHYVAYCKDSDGWNCYNDDRIHFVSTHDIETKLYVQGKHSSFISFLWYELTDDVDE